MSYEILEGQARKFRQHGTLKSTVTETVPEGQFLMRSGDGDEYDVITTSGAPIVYINLVSTDRADVIAGGIAVMAGPFELKTTVFDDTSVFSVGDAVTVKKVGSSVSGLLAKAESGDYIHGYVVQAPSQANGGMLRVRLDAVSVGTV